VARRRISSCPGSWPGGAALSRTVWSPPMQSGRAGAFEEEAAPRGRYEALRARVRPDALQKLRRGREKAWRAARSDPASPPRSRPIRRRRRCGSRSQAGRAARYGASSSTTSSGIPAETSRARAGVPSSSIASPRRHATLPHPTSARRSIPGSAAAWGSPSCSRVITRAAGEQGRVHLLPTLQTILAAEEIRAEKLRKELLRHL
jgi:hypothetical protein